MNVPDGPDWMGGGGGGASVVGGGGGGVTLVDTKILNSNTVVVMWSPKTSVAVNYGGVEVQNT